MSPARSEISKAAADAILSAQSVTPSAGMTAKAGLALLSVEQGDKSAAKGHYTHLEGQQGTMLWTYSSVDRLLSLLSVTLGKLDQATVHFEDALAFCGKARYRPELAWTCSDYADTLRERDAEGARTKAITLPDESLAISRELGMRPLMERVLSRREIFGA